MTARGPPPSYCVMDGQRTRHHLVLLLSRALYISAWGAAPLARAAQDDAKAMRAISERIAATKDRVVVEAELKVVLGYSGSAKGHRSWRRIKVRSRAARLACVQARCPSQPGSAAVACRAGCVAQSPTLLPHARLRARLRVRLHVQGKLEKSGHVAVFPVEMDGKAVVRHALVPSLPSAMPL